MSGQTVTIFDEESKQSTLIKVILPDEEDYTFLKIDPGQGQTITILE